MATTVEYHNLDKAADIAMRLSEKANSGFVTKVREGIPIMVAMVSNKPVEHVDDEVATRPVIYNHPLFLCDADEVMEISRLQELVYPDSARPLLYESPRYPDLFFDSFTGRARQSNLHLDLDEIAENVAHDVVSVAHEDVGALHDATEGIVDIDERYKTYRRGRSSYRANVPDVDCDRPRASYAHRHGRRILSLPPVYDRFLQCHDLDPLENRVSDEEHKHELVELFRKTSEAHLLDANSASKPLLEFGVGEGKFSQSDIYMQSYKFARQRSSKDLLVPENVQMIRNYLKHSSHIRYDVTMEIVEQTLFAEQTIVSAGRINFVELPASDDNEADLPDQPRKSKSGLPLRLPKEITRENKLRARGRCKPQLLSEKIEPSPEKVPEDVTTAVYLDLPTDTNIKQYARIRIQQKYIDTSCSKQVSHNVAINITDRNARRESYFPSRTEPAPPFYKDAVALFNVSNPGFQSRLEHLFSHVVKSEPDYIAKLMRSLRLESQLWMLTFPHNNAHWTSNLFSCDPEQPTTLSAFSSAVKAQPQVFILFRGREITALSLRDVICDRFEEQVDYDPLPDKLLVEPLSNNPYTPTSFRPVGEVSHMHLIAEATFDDFSDYMLRTAAGTAYEANWASSDGHANYNGTCVLLPVAKTFNKKDRVYMVYAGAMKLDKQSLKNPSLQKGQRLVVWIDIETLQETPHEIPQPEKPWSATVWTRHVWADLDDVCFFAMRPTEKGNDDERKVEDLRSLHDLTCDDVDRSSLADLQHHVRRVRRLSVAAKAAIDEKELKRKLKALTNMHVSTGLEVNDPVRAQSLLDSQNMLMCKNPNGLPRNGIYDCVEFDEAASGYVLAMLSQDQRAKLLDLAEYGMCNRTAFINGVSGSGKSHFKRVLGLPFVGGQVRTRSFRNVMRNREIAALQLDKKSRPNVHNKDDETFQNITLTTPDATRPAFIESIDGVYDPNGTIIEKGRSLYVALTNDTADAMYTALCRDATAFCAAVNRPVPLIYRRYPKATEISALKAVLHPKFAHGHDLPHTFDDTITVVPGGTNETVCGAYEDLYHGSSYRAIRDVRFKDLSSSAAAKIYMMSLAEEYQTEDIRAAFTLAERDMLRAELISIQDVEEELEHTKAHQWTNEQIKLVETACKFGFDWLDLKADIVVTTTSVASETRFSLFRQPHFIGIEEFGRVDDPTMASFYSHYHSTLARVCVGDYRQIGVQLRGEKNANPLYRQVQYSFLGRIRDAGFPVTDFMETSRFGNQEQLKLVQLINRDKSITMRASAQRPEDTARVESAHHSVYAPEVRTPVIFINYRDSEQHARKAASGSTFNVQTAILSIHHIKQLVLNGMTGDEIVLTSPYKTQTELHATLLSAAIKDEKYRNPVLADHLERIRCSTIDSFMGEESLYHCTDSCSVQGHLFADVSRAAVLFSRAKIGFCMIGSSTAFLAAKDKYPFSHPCKEVIRSMIREHRYVDVPSAFMDSRS